VAEIATVAPKTADVGEVIEMDWAAFAPGCGVTIPVIETADDAVIGE
jgi:hypothetical protein